MQARMKNPAMIVPEAMKAFQGLQAAVDAAAAKGEVPPKTLALVHLRASQINGCGFCVDIGARHARKDGESDDRLFAVSAWRDTPYFNDAERSALALAECVTRLSDQADPVPDAIWNEAARHFSEAGLSALLLSIGLTNLYNRINVPTRQVAGAWKPQ